MPVGIKELKPKKKMPLPKPKPRHANPKHPMNTEKTKPLAKASGGSVKVGEKGTPKTLSQIAAKNNISLRDLLAANPSIKNANKIRLGQSIKLPSTKMTGSSIGATRNPYKNMSKKDMADMDVKNKSAKRQQAVTKRSRVSALDDVKAKAKAPKALPKLSNSIAKADSEETAKQKASRTGSIKSATTAKNKRLDEMRAKYRGRADRRMGGGKMKKVSGYKSGGMVRGAGAATKGKRFGRCG